MPKKPTLHLTGPNDGPPTLADLVKLTEALTGQTPSPETVDKMRAMLPHEPLPFRTQEEAELLRLFIRDRGQEWTDQWADSVIGQARDFGDLDPEVELTRH